MASALVKKKGEKMMKQHMKRIFSLLIACSMLVSSTLTTLPVSARDDVQSQKLETQETVQKDVTENFENASVDNLDAKYEAYQFNSDGSGVTKGDKVSAYWSIGKSVPGYSYSYNTAYLRPTHNGSANKLAQLTLKDANMKDFEAKVAIANNYTQYGMCIAPAGESYKSANAIWVNVQSGGTISVGGAVDVDQANVTGSDKVVGMKRDHVRTKDIPGFKSVDNNNCDKTVYNLVVSCKDGVITAYIEEYSNVQISVKTADAYQGGSFSLYSIGCNQGGFKSYSLKYTKLEAEDDGATVSKKFAAMGSATKLDTDYKAYQFSADGSNKVEKKPSELWSTEKTSSILGSFNTSYLRPLHRGNANKIAVLSYEKETMTDFEASVVLASNYVQYGILIGPAGEWKNTNRGIGVYVSAEGAISVSGAIDASTGKYDGEIIDYRDHAITTGNLSEFKVPNNNKSEETLYHLHVKVENGVLTTYLEENEEQKVTVNVSDKYEGGVFSLYSTGCNQGGFESFRVVKMENGTKPQPADGEFIQSFTDLDSIMDLSADFEAYTLDDIANPMQVAKISDVFQITGGRMRSNLTTSGTETTDFGILTLKTKEYQNFELELRYEQGWKRYGVMFGTKLGEFAYGGTDNAIRGKDGGVFVYTEAEGYRSARGSLTGTSFTNASLALARLTENPMLKSFTNRSGKDNDVSKNISQRVMHSMVIRVVGDCMTMVVDNNEASRMTVRLEDYAGGYISLVTNGRNNQDGAFHYLKVTELGEDAELGVAQPPTAPGFSSLSKVEKDFDAYHLEDASVSNKMVAVKVKDLWWINDKGYIARDEEKRSTETTDVAVLTYAKQKYTDFEVSFTYQQTWNRTGILIGTEKGKFPLQVKDKKNVAAGGIMLFLEAEGHVNALGDFVSGYTHETEVKQRVVSDGTGFTNEAGSAADNVTALKMHKVKIVVKNKDLFVFVDDSKEYSMYLRLPDSYKGGYVSLFSAAPRQFGMNHFEISETITTAIPEKNAVDLNETQMKLSFDEQYLDTSKFATYYLDKLDEKGSLKPVSFYDYWMVANGSLTRKSNSVSGSDIKNVGVLTYTERKYTDFVATFEYEKTAGRLMFLFGGKNGSYPLYEKNGNHENGGIILYPENDLGNPGGICALGDVKLSNSEYRPIYRELPYAPGYHDQKNSKASEGAVHKMTVAVIDRHVYVYLDDYGLVTQLDLTEAYQGGYISLASTGTKQHGFLSLSIQEISGAGNVIKEVEKKRDITVLAGTPLESIPLPGSAKVTMKDGSKANVAVTWKDCGYDQATVGEYRFVGTLQPQAGISNEGLVSAILTVRVRTSLPNTSGGTKTWTFDTDDDLQDFKCYYVEDAAKGGAVEKDFPMWYVEKGTLRRDRNRSTNGSENRNLYILTYTGRTYKNFELKVDVSQEYTRQMILFGSAKPGQYIDYANPKIKTNPIAAFVEFEGNRNAIGNVVNTNYYTRLDEHVANVRETAPANPNYYNKDNPKENMGTMHTLTVRVVGDTISMYLDDIKEVFSGKIDDSYKGGYISLATATKATKYDNLSITALNEQGEPMEDNLEVVANGTLNLTLGEDVPVKSVVPAKKTVEERKLPIMWIICPIAGMVLVTGVVIGLVVWKKRKNKKEGN